MVAELNVGFLGGELREFRRVLGQGEPPGS